MNEYKILGARWFTNITTSRTPYENTCIGVIAVETFEPTREWKAYIGCGAGITQKTDEQQIARHGSELSPDEAQGFFPNLDIAKYKQY